MRLDNYYVYWKYTLAKDFTWTTICIVITDRDVTHKGLAVLSDKDRFVKDIGRKISLARAIMYFPKIERTKIWAAYFGRSSKHTK